LEKKMKECIYQGGIPDCGVVECGLDKRILDTEFCSTCKDKVKPKTDRSDCIHRYEKSIGDESWSFCGEPMEDRCVEGDICDYCDAYEPDEEEEDG
jgi:hypothetical protein